MRLIQQEDAVGDAGASAGIEGVAAGLVEGEVRRPRVREDVQRRHGRHGEEPESAPPARPVTSAITRSRER